MRYYIYYVIICFKIYLCSWYSDSLRPGRFGHRIQVGARFYPPVQTVPWAHPASYTMGTGSLLGAKRQKR